MKKFASVIIPSLATVFLFTGIASAHVTVQPSETAQGSYQVFTVRVPSEKDVPTMKVEVKIPNGVDITRFEPKSGWKYSLTKDSSGKVTSVTWTATGEGLTSTEFGQFNMNGKVADDAKEIKWKAYQTYKDGSVAEWVGAPGSDTPAPVTMVNPKPAQKTPAGAQKPSNIPLYISIAALAASLLSLIISLRKKA